MQLIKPDTHIDFIGKWKIAFVFSAVMIAVTIVSLVVHKGLRLGIDFAGGTQVQVQFDKAVTIGDIKVGLAAMNITSGSVQQMGALDMNEFRILANLPEEQETSFQADLKTALETATGAAAEIRLFEMVGPQVGKQLREKALLAMFYALLFITIYISGRFEFKWLVSGLVVAALIGAVNLLFFFDISIAVLIVLALMVAIGLFWVLELKFAMGAIVALIHDVTITVGVFSLFGKEFSLPIIAALLTIIGYSLNDTIIVFDRIRENMKKAGKKAMADVINTSVNETLSRTLLTSMTTLVVVIMLFVFGGSIIHDFALAMIIGILVGTYSSVYVASPFLLFWQNRRAKR